MNFDLMTNQSCVIYITNFLSTHTVLSPYRGYMTYTPKTMHERILHRFKIAQGHLHKVVTMIEQREYCIDILHQSQAVQKALKEADNVMLENHLKTCVVDALGKGHTEEAVAEVMNIFKKAR